MSQSRLKTGASPLVLARQKHASTNHDLVWFQYNRWKNQSTLTTFLVTSSPLNQIQIKGEAVTLWTRDKVSMYEVLV